MPATKRPSATVDLHGIALQEMRDFVNVAWELDEGGRIPDKAFPALVRLNDACRNAENSPDDPFTPRPGVDPWDILKTVWKVPRAPLELLVTAVAPYSTDQQTLRDYPNTPAAVTKVAARLKSPEGRPSKVGTWPQRAAEVARVRNELRARGIVPTDARIAAALDVAPATVRAWRHRRPKLFGLPILD